jgi:hypothetical protein
MQHAVKEGFSKQHIVSVVLEGSVIETYSERARCLLYDEVLMEGTLLPLHVVCEHAAADAAVDVVTAYVPSELEWERPTQRRVRRR